MRKEKGLRDCVDDVNEVVGCDVLLELHGYCVCGYLLSSKDIFEGPVAVYLIFGLPILEPLKFYVLPNSVQDVHK